MRTLSILTSVRLCRGHRFVASPAGRGFLECVQNENLSLSVKPDWASGAQYRVDVDIIAGGVFYRHASGYGCRMIGHDQMGACTGLAAAASVGQAVSRASSARETVFFISSPPSARRYKANRYRQHRASPPTMIALSFSAFQGLPSCGVYCASRQIMLYLPAGAVV